MGVVIQAESHHNELAAIYVMEHDPATLAFYDQPPPIKLVYRARHGRQLGIFHTPDFFVLRTTGIGWEEWKLEQRRRAIFRLSAAARVLSARSTHWPRLPGGSSGWRRPV
jgi:putative transposase